MIDEPERILLLNPAQYSTDSGPVYADAGDEDAIEYVRADLAPSVKPLEWRKAEDAPESETVLLWGANWLDPRLGYRGSDGDFYDLQMRCFHSDPTHCMVLSTPEDQPTPSDKDAEIERLREALIEYMDHDKDYATLNNLGDHTASHRWKRACAALGERV